jgi:probable rRNA maturation factor
MIDVEIDDPAWTTAAPKAAELTEQAAIATLKAALSAVEGDLVILLTDDATVQRLNRDFRGKDQPTNVLSFPAAPNSQDHLGDVALAYGVCAAEAVAQGIPLADHLAHLTAHGVLHLLGYDHQIDSEAEAMEALEAKVLAGLGVADPYADDGD